MSGDRSRETARDTEERPGWDRGRTYAAIYAALAFLFFLPALLPGRDIFGTDYLAAAYFKYVFTSGLMADGVLPSWNPHIFGGLPLFANPASTFLPTRLLADLFLPVPKLLPATLVIHFALAGIGAYLLARELGVRRWLAFLAGLAFQFTGLAMSYVYAGHDGRIIVATLSPLFFFFLHRGIRLGTLPWFAGAAATLGVGLLTFQIQSNYYLLLAGALWAIFTLVHLGYIRRPGPLSKRLALGLGAVAFGFALAAVNFLPFLDYVDASPRGGNEGRGYEYATSWAMSPGEITALAVPELDGVSVSDPMTGEPRFPSYQGENPFKLHTEYAGALVLLLLALGAYYSRRDRYWWFFLGLATFGLTISFGGHTPIYRLYYEVLPGTSRFRAPSIAFFLVSFSLVMMAALTLERLAERRAGADADGRAATGGRQSGAARRERARKGGRPGAGGAELDPATAAGGLAAVVAVLGLIIAGAMSGDEPERAAGVFRFAFFTALIGGALWAWLGGRVSRRTALVLLAILTVADLWIIDRRFLATVPPPDDLFARDDVATFLVSQPGRDRVWSLPFPGTSYRQGNYLMRFGIDQAGGEHPNQLQSYNEYVGAGEVTYVDWHNFLQHPQFLNAANVRYLVSSSPLQGLPEVHRGSAIVYENPNALPRAYMVGEVVVAPPDGAVTAMAADDFDPATTAILYEPPARPLPGSDGARTTGGATGEPAEAGGIAAGADSPGRAEIAEYEPARVVVETESDQRALLVLADNMYEGWEATVDGTPVPIHVTNHTFRGVVVEPGEHRVVFEFRPADLYLGFWIYVAGLALLLAYGVFLSVRWVRGRPRGG